jgi:pyruvate dehydrogenase (quinone)/pyruvate oxidase
MTQQDVQVDRLFEDVAVYNARVMGPAHVTNVTHLAIRTAYAQRGVAHVTIPVDVQSMSMGADHRSERNEKGHANAHWAPNRTLAAPAELDRVCSRGVGSRRRRMATASGLMSERGRA